VLFVVRIFHTADVHLGLKFVRASLDSIRQSLVDARLEVLARMVSIAMQEKCELFVIAGDLFDSLNVPKAVVRKAAETLRKFDGLVVVLPGNHDYVQAKSDEDLWLGFSETLGDGHKVLREIGISDLRTVGLPVVLYAGPCTTRHSPTNRIGWVQQASMQDVGTHFKIGIAHGSLDGLSPDFNSDYFPMTRQELDACGLDLWLLGHTHVRYPDRESGKGERIFYPSVPEPDGFDCRHGGSAWIIDLLEGSTPEYRSVHTGSFRFHDLKVNSHLDSEFNALTDFVSKLSPKSDLVKLALSGRIESEIFAKLPLLIQELEKKVLHLEADVSGLLQVIQQSDIDGEFTEASFPHRLLTELALNPDDHLALQMAYELVNEARS